jgi:type IX secretion system PorP/SprF family membrane protein
MRRVRTLLCLYVLLLPVCVHAQDVTNFTQFFINPYTFNPSYAGIEGRSAMFLSYRRQWATIDGGPSVGNFSYHAPLVGGLNFGLSVSNDTRGVLNTTGAALTLGYTVSLGQQKFIRFGLSAGGASNGVDLDAVADANDPALSALLDNSFSLLGSAGISVHLKSFHFGASLPSIFAPTFVSSEDFTIAEVKPFQNLILHASNRFYFGDDRFIFEPYVLYRMNNGPRDGEVLPSQYEVAGVLHLNHFVWVGGSYKQDFGISALGGIKNQFFLLGASYSVKNSGINELNSPTYEMHLGYLFGQKKNKPVYSFVNSEKEKIKKPPVKTPAQLAAEKKKQEELAKQQAEAEALAQEEAERAERERQAVVAAAAAEEARVVREAAARAEEARVAEEQRQVEAREEQVRRQEAQRAETQRAEAARAEEQKRQEEVRAAQEKQRETERAAVVTAPVVVPPVVVPPVIEPRVEKVDPPKQEVVIAKPVERPIEKPVEQPIEIPVEVQPDPVITPTPQRHETIQRGTHPRELESGNYVINGVFSTSANADRFVRRLNSLGFAAKNGFLTNKGFWYVYVFQSDDIEAVRRERDRYRTLAVFKDAWLLTVEH